MTPTTQLNLQPLSYEVIARENDDPQNVQKYSTFNHSSGTTWLAFRDLANLFKRYVNGTQGIDYGCGAGRSTRYLKSLGMNPIGVDISEEMLTKAKEINRENNLDIRYKKIKSGEIPAADKTYDFVFSSFVFLVIPEKSEMKKILKEMHRILTPNGTVIIVTGNEKMHDPHRKWVSYETNFPENEQLISGGLAKVRIKEVGAEFYDYNWLNEDYQEVFASSGFTTAETLTPIGYAHDNRAWEDEIVHSPYYIYVLKKAVDS